MIAVCQYFSSWKRNIYHSLKILCYWLTCNLCSWQSCLKGLKVLLSYRSFQSLLMIPHCSHESIQCRSTSASFNTQPIPCNKTLLHFKCYVDIKKAHILKGIHAHLHESNKHYTLCVHLHALEHHNNTITVQSCFLYIVRMGTPVETIESPDCEHKA